MAIDSRLGLAQLGYLVLGDLLALTIQPTGIPSEEAFGTAAVYQAGTIYPTSIDSAEAFGSSSFGQSITVSPSSIASAEAFGTVALAFTALSQTVSPSGIASLEAFGTASVAGPPQSIICSGIASAEAFGFPLLAHAGAPYDRPRIYFNGTELPFLGPGTATIQEQIQQRGQATFDLVWLTSGTPTAPIVGQHVRFTDNYRVEFVGFVTAVKASVVPYSRGGPYFSGNALKFAVTATDLSGIADRRKVMTTYPAGDVGTIVAAILTNDIPEEGLTANHVSVAGQTVTTVGGGQSLKQSLDSISKDTGALWYIDKYADIHLELPGAGGAAPFDITDSNDTMRDFTYSSNLDTFATSVPARANQTLQ
jgi:hypothetical protein